MKNTILIFILSFSVIGQAFAQRTFDNKFNVVFGVNQVLLDGFNAEVNVFYKRLAFDYSHGVSLDFKGAAVTEAEKDQRLVIHLPYTTGFGVGYRINDAFNIRVEPKWHRFELFYENEIQNASSRVAGYSTFTLGLGAYYNWQPFKEKTNALRGLMIAPSVRFWPKISSTLNEDQVSYQNRLTGRTETHEAMEVGIGNTPWVFNISVGYSFKWK